jgi:hypothetical protein
MTSRDVIDFVAIRFLVEGFPTECDVGLALTGAQRPFYSWDSPLCRPKSLQKRTSPNSERLSRGVYLPMAITPSVLELER